MPWFAGFVKGDQYADPKRTWGGDEYCAHLVGKSPSGPLNLDHTMTKVGSARRIQTSLIESGFDAAIYNETALSDHNGLYSKIALKKIFVVGD